jgi:hypothetical protein
VMCSLIFLITSLALVILTFFLLIREIRNEVIGASTIIASSLFLVRKFPLSKLVNLHLQSSFCMSS